MAIGLEAMQAGTLKVTAADGDIGADEAHALGPLPPLSDELREPIWPAV